MPAAKGDPQSAAERRRKRKATLIKKILTKIGRKLSGTEDVKATIGEFVRLVELEKSLQDELDQDAVREIKVTWIDPESQESASET